MAMRPQPREMPENMTRRQRRDNWWRYHWLQVLIGVLAVIVLAGAAWERFTRERYDCSVALVTRYAATPAEIASIQEALERVCPDLDDAAIQTMVTNVDKLNADFYTRQSGIFLLDDPENFQASHEALSRMDGAAPPEGALDWENMTIPWKDWAGSNQVELDNCEADRLWFARRAVFDKADEAAFRGAGALWAAIFGTE